MKLASVAVVASRRCSLRGMLKLPLKSRSECQSARRVRFSGYRISSGLIEIVRSLGQIQIALLIFICFTQRYGEEHGKNFRGQLIIYREHPSC